MLDDQDKEWILRELARQDANWQRLEAKLEHVETNLLTEFHKWASPAEARARTLQLLELSI